MYFELCNLVKTFEIGKHFKHRFIYLMVNLTIRPNFYKQLALKHLSKQNASYNIKISKFNCIHLHAIALELAKCL